MLFVFAGKLVSVAQYDLPLAVFTAVGLGAAQCPGLRLITGVISNLDRELSPVVSGGVGISVL